MLVSYFIVGTFVNGLILIHLLHSYSLLFAGPGHRVPAAQNHLYWRQGEVPPTERDHQEAGECVLQPYRNGVHAYQQPGPDQLDQVGWQIYSY